MKLRIPLAAGLLAVLASASATSAPRGSAGPRVQSFGVTKAPGSAKVSEPGGRNKTKPPKSLSSTEKAALLHQEFGIDAEPSSTYARVDPSDAEAKGKASLVFAGAEIVNAAQSFASWKALDEDDFLEAFAHAFSGVPYPHYAGLWLKAEGQGSRYLVDCSVWSDGAGFGVAFDDGTSQSHNLPAGNVHLTWVVESPDAGWHAFRFGGQNAWGLHGCRIDRV